MSDGSPALTVRVWGDYACFTRPEMKVERVTYPVMTPSGARGALEAIFWKPEFQWVVRRIDVLKPIRYFSILRNEVNKRQSERTAAGWARTGTGGYDASADRAQRHTLGLRDVAYVIHADVRLRDDVREDPAKFRDQFRRRVARGQCFAMPYLGCREFSAGFGPPEPGDQPLAGLSEDLGPMLLDIDFAIDPETGNSTGLGKPRFFNAALQDGVLAVPDRFAEAP
jgi:CRISPR-associated protein Cas5d